MHYLITYVYPHKGMEVTLYNISPKIIFSEKVYAHSAYKVSV